MNKIDGWLYTLVILFVVNVVLIILSWNSILFAPTATTPSQVTVGAFYSINLVGMGSGIVFDPVNTAPLVDNPAAGNDGGIGATTLYGIQSLDSSVPIELCTKANRVLTDDGNGNTLGVLAAETYASDTANTPTVPGPSGSSVSFTTSDVQMPGPALNNGQTLWTRFWIDVTNPSQPAGTYTNTITFTAQQVGGTTC